ncbi:hypothetical protein [Methylocaldum sp.]|nr:hypothetical protein [Methylocaldum sp.]HYE34430.1 hypothetical protein [Methylocaldum sp.]
MNFRVEKSTEGFRCRFEIRDRKRIGWAVIHDPETMGIIDTLRLD